MEDHARFSVRTGTVKLLPGPVGQASFVLLYSPLAVGLTGKFSGGCVLPLIPLPWRVSKSWQVIVKYSCQVEVALMISDQPVATITC